MTNCEKSFKNCREEFDSKRLNRNIISIVEFQTISFNAHNTFYKNLLWFECFGQSLHVFDDTIEIQEFSPIIKSNFYISWEMC